LELTFATKSLRQLCESEAAAKRELGADVAERLKRRLADLRAAAHVNDLVAGQPREIEGAHNRCIAVHLYDGYRIVFCANHRTVPVLDSGSVDWSGVRRVKILGIERQHD
jgi:plasmid maintenance system killer protein